MPHELGSRKDLNTTVDLLPGCARSRPMFWSPTMQISAHTIAAQEISGRADNTTASSSRLADRMLGLSLMAIAPALFWTTMLAMLAPRLGFDPSHIALAIFGIAVAAFLGCVCCALTSRKN